MKGSETKLVAYMQGSDKRFVIPVYQRNYDWKTENCKQLYEDLVKVVHKGRKSHFFGSMVSVHNPEGQMNEFLVIDGQQRLTTVSLLLLAMCNLLERKVVTSENVALRERIYEEYLVDKWQVEDTRIKLKSVKNDQNAFCKLFCEESEYIKESNLTINYKYFYERIPKQEITVDELFDAIYRLEMINIILKPDEDNPQLIFESLNSTGVALNEGDKIRNFILMGLPTKDQEKFYEKYWNRIEICCDYDVSSFIKDYLSVKRQAIPSQSKIYFTFKAFVEEAMWATEDLLKDLLAYAKLYEVLLKGKTPDKYLNACIDRLNRLETTITRPFFLEVLRLQSEGKLTVAEVADIFSTTENYLFRRTMCDLPTNALSKIFLLLHREITRYDGTEENYVAKFKYALLSKKERARFPDDTEFTTAFSERPVYLMNSKHKIYILERMENFGTKEDKDVYRHVEDGEYSIEHIMPQHPTLAWKKSVGEEYEQISAVWLHRIANLTLTAYNSKYSNSPFIEKRDMKNGFRDSGIRLNAYFVKKDNWTLVELEERSRHLMNYALKIWNSSVTTFKPEKKQVDFRTLDDDANLSGRQIVRFSYKNTEQPVASWADMYECVLKILHTEDKSVLSRLAYTMDNSIELASYVSSKKTDVRSGTEIEDGIYVGKSNSTEAKISLLRRFFKLYDADPTDLVFYLREEAKSDDEIAETRHEIRKRYWAYALEQLQKTHGNNGPFWNVNPTPGNYIHGFVGEIGFHICCVANYDSARVELYLGKTSKKVNKATFDRLFLNKADIEAALGIPLVWYRGDDLKSSMVYCKLDNVNIKKETDWMRMAKFHTDWSKKFYDVMLPYLKSK